MWYIHPAGYSALKRKDILTFATTWMNLEDIIRLSMTNLDNVLKSRDITLPTKSIQSKLWFFQVSCMDVKIEP